MGSVLADSDHIIIMKEKKLIILKMVAKNYDFKKAFQISGKNKGKSFIESFLSDL